MEFIKILCSAVTVGVLVFLTASTANATDESVLISVAADECSVVAATECVDVYVCADELDYNEAIGGIAFVSDCTLVLRGVSDAVALTPEPTPAPAPVIVFTG